MSGTKIRGYTIVPGLGSQISVLAESNSMVASAGLPLPLGTFTEVSDRYRIRVDQGLHTRKEFGCSRWVERNRGQQ
jgi:hypothetical protein